MRLSPLSFHHHVPLHSRGVKHPRPEGVDFQTDGFPAPVRSDGGVVFGCGQRPFRGELVKLHPTGSCLLVGGGVGVGGRASVSMSPNESISLRKFGIWAVNRRPRRPDAWCRLPTLMGQSSHFYCRDVLQRPEKRDRDREGEAEGNEGQLTPWVIRAGRAPFDKDLCKHE